METQSILVVAKCLREREMVSGCLIDLGFPFVVTKNVLELDNDYGCTTL